MSPGATDPTSTSTVTETSTITHTQTMYSHPTNIQFDSYPRPPPVMAAPPPVYAVPPPPPPPPPVYGTPVPLTPPFHNGLIPGSVMGPGTAVLSILVVAGIYWGLKNGSSASVSGFLGGTSNEDDDSSKADEKDKKDKDKSSSKDKDKEKDKESSPQIAIPIVSPSAFILLFIFALLAAVIIQGPLGIGSALNTPLPLQLASLTGRQTPAGLLGESSVPSLLNLISKVLGPASGVGRTPEVNFRVVEEPGSGSGSGSGSRSRSNPPHPQMGGQGQSSGPDGASHWHWFANPLPPLNQPAGLVKEEVVIQLEKMNKADALSYTSLPALLQGVPFCQTSPAICATLLANVNLQELARLIGPALGLTTTGDLGYQANAIGAALGYSPTAQPNPIPMVPAGGFAGSIQGINNLDNAFYPLLVGAIGLIVLFDYGT